MFVNPSSFIPLGQKLGIKAYNSKYRWQIVIVIGLVLLLFFGFIGVMALRENRMKARIHTYDECSKHYSVQLSYPGRCTVPGGQTFVEPIEP